MEFSSSNKILINICYISYVELMYISIWKFPGCFNLVMLQQACDNLALAFARCIQPCVHPLQVAHNLVKINIVYKLYNLARLLQGCCQIVKLYPNSKSYTYLQGYLYKT